MKRLLTLFLVFLSCILNVLAQLPPGRAVSKVISPYPTELENFPTTHDAYFVFDKHYYEAENQWVTFPKWPGVAFTKGIYELCFIYFDAQAGYTMINHGLFDIDANGHAFRDTTISPPRGLGNAAAFYRNPFKAQLTTDQHLVAVIPDKILADLNVKKVPDWLAPYRRNNPDTFKTLNKKLLFGHTFSIMVSDVSKHVGEHVVVQGRLYGGDTSPDPAKPGYSIVSLYIGGGNYPNQKFTILVKGIKAGSNSFAGKFANIQGGENYLSAEGLIFLYQGKPAVEITDDTLGFVTFIDSGRPTPAMQ